MTVLRLMAAALLAGLLSSPAFAEDMPVFKLQMKDGQLIPARLVVPAGKKFKIEVMNIGKTPAEFESTPLRKERCWAPAPSPSWCSSRCRPANTSSSTNST